MTDLRQEIADVLRGRILRGLNGGSVKPGDRLPSARELRDEFGGADHRIILDAYRVLENEGLVELRARGGIYVAALEQGVVPLPSAAWLTQVYSQAVIREIPLPELHHWLRRGAGTLRLRAVAVQSTDDTIAGLVRELRDDYGLSATGMHVGALVKGDAPAEVRHADLLVTTSGCASAVRAVAEKHRKPMIVIEIRPDLIGGEWRLLLRRPVYVIMRDEGFVALLEKFFANTPGAQNIRPIVLGKDSLDVIPDDAAVYITRSARQRLGDQPVRGRLLPSARLFSSASGAEIIRFIVDANLRALSTPHRHG